jgi:hypothetical protein
MGTLMIALCCPSFQMRKHTQRDEVTCHSHTACTMGKQAQGHTVVPCREVLGGWGGKGETH